MEGEPERYFATKYACPRDEVLGEMQDNGWANASSGNVEAPSGYFSRISNSEAELPEIYQAFESTIEEMGTYGFTAEALLGHFLLITDSQGFVNVAQFESEAHLIHDYETLERMYDEWEEGE